MKSMVKTERFPDFSLVRIFLFCHPLPFPFGPLAGRHGSGHQGTFFLFKRFEDQIGIDSAIASARVGIDAAEGRSDPGQRK